MRKSLFFLLWLTSVHSCSSGESDVVLKWDDSRPAIEFKVLFHRYSSYESMDSKLYLYDGRKRDLVELSSGWTSVKHPMNPHCSPDGRQYLFMGIGESGSWDIFLHSFDSKQEPKCLTPNSSAREEDPKFSSDGSSIVYKRDGQLWLMELSSGNRRQLTFDLNNEYSMPYFTVDNRSVICSKGAKSEASIVWVDVQSGAISSLVDRLGVLDYYPIVVDAKRYYFTSHFSESNFHDQIYQGSFDGSFPLSLPFNSSESDASDAYPYGEEWVIFSSTRKGAIGQYDLFVGHRYSGKVYSLSEYLPSINSVESELGATLCPN